jgi:hypothetical protein
MRKRLQQDLLSVPKVKKPPHIAPGVSSLKKALLRIKMSPKIESDEHVSSNICHSMEQEGILSA